MRTKSGSGIGPAVRFKRRLARAFLEFDRLETSGGLVLLGCALVALVWANSIWSDSYFEIASTTIALQIGSFLIDKPLILWINDGLMALFFFVVGLEIKRELVAGELSSVKKAALPAAAAIGGVVVPAAIYLAFNAGTPSERGWGIPMATDIAFSLGVLALLGKRAPYELKVFLTALAIVDDLIALLVIALFYTHDINLTALGYAAGLMGVLTMLNLAQVRNLVPYVLLGLVLWVLILKSGVHATIAGVLVAFAVPVRNVVDSRKFVEDSLHAIETFKASETGTYNDLPSEGQVDAIHDLSRLAYSVQSPLIRAELMIHPWTTYFVVPVFGLMNAGIELHGSVHQALLERTTLGVILGLVIGKPVGIFLASWLGVKLKLVQMPRNFTYGIVLGAGALAGIGFTMSLFISELAFKDPVLLYDAKLGILTASAVSAILGLLLLKRFLRKAGT
ncbi:MAG: Na+/H+ antiporter NhaA [Fimbriimonadaceae bacterium]|nr:Na+/H+ antiporter NhaA [Fimbriimonadaceae bacterium]QOJ11641.1 MAG: Na+/H+ antiporter NhaA [Chthonomonadaceae bacterium]